MHSNTLLETKDVELAIDNLTTEFQNKITALSADVKAANDNVKAATARADALELRFNRPRTAANNNEPSTETKAFEHFIRRGQAGLAPDEAKSLRVSDDTAGGYLAPEQFNAELDRNVVLFSPVRQVARVLPTGAGSVLWPKRTGGMTASWVGETAERPATTVTFGQNRYPVCELAAYVDVSNTMLEDAAFDVAALLQFEFAEDFGRAESAAFVTGASVLSPSGYMQDTGLGYTAGGDAALVKADGLIDLYHAVKTPYRANSVWAMNSNTLGAVRKLKDSTGQYLLSMAGIANSPVTTILGRPVLEMPDMPDIGAGTYPIVFGDFANGYRIFDRISLSVLRDPYTQATSGMTRFHGRRRVAAGVGKAEALRKLKIATS